MGVLAIVGSTPSLPKEIDWKNPPIGWVLTSFAPDKDMTEAKNLGTIPFASQESAWGPPCFYPPDVIENCYKIHKRGMIWKTTEAKDVEGMRLCRTVTPAQLAEFLRERLAAGELKRFNERGGTL